jgi:hypothetical protein
MAKKSKKHLKSASVSKKLAPELFMVGVVGLVAVVGIFVLMIGGSLSFSNSDLAGEASAFVRLTSSANSECADGGGTTACIDYCTNTGAAYCVDCEGNVGFSCSVYSDYELEEYEEKLDDIYEVEKKSTSYRYRTGSS